MKATQLIESCDSVLEAKLTGDKLMDALRKIVKEKTAAKINGMLVDLFTASAIIKVFDALNIGNQEKFKDMPLLKMQKVAFQLIK